MHTNVYTAANKGARAVLIWVLESMHMEFLESTKKYLQPHNNAPRAILKWFVVYNVHRDTEI